MRRLPSLELSEIDQRSRYLPARAVVVSGTQTPVVEHGYVQPGGCPIGVVRPDSVELAYPKPVRAGREELSQRCCTSAQQVGRRDIA